MGFAAAYFDQFLAIWPEYGLVSTGYNSDPHNQVLVMNDRHKGTIHLQACGD